MVKIIGISLDNRVSTSQEFQKVLTKYGCIIKTRLGLHGAGETNCSNRGIIILEVIDCMEEKEFEIALKSIPEVEIQTMTF